MASDKEVKYVCMALHRWAGCELSSCPPGIFVGPCNGSVGFMEVFDDVEKLKAAYPDAEIMKVTRLE